VNIANERKYLENQLAIARASGNKGLETWAKKQAQKIGIILSGPTNTNPVNYFKDDHNAYTAGPSSPVGSSSGSGIVTTMQSVSNGGNFLTYALIIGLIMLLKR
jgi:hypothetical protein